MFASNIEANPEQRGGITVNFFYSSLAPYGEWIEIDYGFYVWRPLRVSRAWTPYASGRWAWTRYGWYWDSYEPFGWAVYHYGRWHYDSYYGWVWVPDTEWGPAWVEWRYDNDYIGWAPLPPYAVCRPGFGIRFTKVWTTPYIHFHFVKIVYFHNHNVNRYFVAKHNKQKIFTRTKYRADYGYDGGRIINRGVDRDFVEKRSRTKVREMEIASTNERNRYENTRNTDKTRIVSYTPGDDEIKRVERTRDFEIKRSDRKSTLEVERVELEGRSSGWENRRDGGDVKDRDTRTDNVQREDRNEIERKANTRTDNTTDRNVDNRGNIERKSIDNKTETKTNVNVRTDNNERKQENTRINDNKNRVETERKTNENTRVNDRRNTDNNNKTRNDAQTDRNKNTNDRSKTEGSGNRRK